MLYFAPISASFDFFLQNPFCIIFIFLQSECLKHLLHNLRSDKGLLCDPALALNRDGTRASPTITNATSKTNANQLNDFTKKDNNCLAAAAALNNTGKGNHPNNTSTTSSDTQKLVALYNLVESQKNTLSRLSNCLDGAEKQRISLIKDLEEEREKNSQLQAQSNRILEETKSISKENAEVHISSTTYIYLFSQEFIQGVLFGIGLNESYLVGQNYNNKILYFRTF